MSSLISQRRTSPIYSPLAYTLVLDLASITSHDATGKMSQRYREIQRAAAFNRGVRRGGPTLTVSKHTNTDGSNPRSDTPLKMKRGTWPQRDSVV